MNYWNSGRMLQSGRIVMDGEYLYLLLLCIAMSIHLCCIDLSYVHITYVCIILFYLGILCTLLVYATAQVPLHQPCSTPIQKLLPFPILRSNSIHCTLQLFTVPMAHYCSVCIIAIPMLSKQGQRLTAGFRCTWHVTRMQLQEQYAFCLSTTRMQQR